MKEFTRILKQTCTSNAMVCAIYAIFGSIVGIIITLFILYVDGTGEDYAHIGAFLSLLIGVFMSFIAGIMMFPLDFNLALSMGKARKYLIPANYIGWVINILVIMVITLVTSIVEDNLYQLSYPNAVCEIDIKAFVSTPIVMVIIVLCVPAVILFIGAMAMRFGTKYMWMCWVLVILGSRIPSAVSENPDSFVGRIGSGVADFLARGAMLEVTCMGIGMILLVIAFLLLRKQRVTL